LVNGNRHDPAIIVARKSNQPVEQASERRAFEYYDINNMRVQYIFPLAIGESASKKQRLMSGGGEKKRRIKPFFLLLFQRGAKSRILHTKTAAKTTTW